MEQETTTGEPIPAQEGNATSTSKLTRLLGNFVLGGAAILVVIVLIAATLARFDIIGKLAGFGPFYLARVPAIVLAVVGLGTLVMAYMRKTGGVWKAALGTALSLGLVAAIYIMLVIPAGKVPPIHDVTTDLVSPPQFVALDQPMTSTGPYSLEEWRAFHEEAYGDIRPIVIGKSPELVLAEAQALAEARGWEIAAYDAAAGRMEATATAGYVRFYDDVVVEVTPIEDGSTRVDMRSVSRVGVSDVGYNAARIRSFLADLRAAN